jgi:hypothetical protein
MKSAKWMRRVIAGVSVLSLFAIAVTAEGSKEVTSVPTISSWNQLLDGLRDLAPEMLSRLPPEMQKDPQIQQEVGRLILSTLAGMSISAISSDPDRPFFVPGPNWTLSYGQPNADTNYRMASIAPGGTYRLRGMRGSLRLARLAQFGSRPGAKGRASLYTITYNDIGSLSIDAQGRYDVILSPKRPEGYTGDWWELDKATTRLMLRLVADDWTMERDTTISIERLDQPATRHRRTAEDLEARLKALSKETAEMALLLVDHVVGLQKEGYVNKLKVFDVSQIGGQLTGQFYYEGAYDLKDDEALIVEAKVPDKCLYYSMILTNEIYETTNWYDNHSSQNDSQMRIDKDGLLRVVISAKDPGAWNWLDTAGYSRGVIQGRWTECSSHPVPTVRKVAFRDIRSALPSDTVFVTAAEREANIRERRALLQQRPLW